MPLITLPSMITNNSSSLIDHISSNTKNKFIDSGIIYSTLSDHYPAFCINNANYKFEKLAKQNTFKRKINDNTITIFKDKLNNADWSSIIQESVPKLAFKSFESVLSKCYLESFPLIQRKESKHVTPVEPWITKAMFVSRRTKNKLEAKSIKNPTLFNIKKYKDYKTIYDGRIFGNVNLVMTIW